MSNFTQGTIYIEEYISGFQNLWADYADIVYENIPVSALSVVQVVDETSKKDQFLIKFLSEFEIAHSHLMNRHLVLSLDACLSELLRSSVLLLWLKSCNYSKKSGHFSTGCLTRPERKKGTAFHASIGTSSLDTLPTVIPVTPSPIPTSSANPNTLTSEMLPISVVGDLSPTIADVFVSPDLSKNLLSVDQASGKLIAKGPKIGQLFPLKVFLSTIIPCAPLFSFECNVVGSTTCSSLDLCFECSSCKLGRSMVLPFPHHASHASYYFDIIRSDFLGIAPVVSHAHYKYFVTFIDDFYHFTWVYILQGKFEVFVVFKHFLALLETQFSTHIKVLPSDFGGEYWSNDFQNFLLSKDIISQRSCPLTPHQNGVVELKNCHLLDMLDESSRGDADELVTQGSSEVP
ncbi:uncharacterized protein [Aristolochia californica]|uniref:uncharacterized protein n=1 Tax=Aristolochia californica TaxID=171875 RepID=UPI0035E38064